MKEGAGFLSEESGELGMGWDGRASEMLCDFVLRRTLRGDLCFCEVKHQDSWKKAILY